MHRFSCLPKCPWFPQSPVNGSLETASLTSQHMTLELQQSRNLLWAEFISLLHPTAVLLPIWKHSHFCGWLNHLIRFWGFALDEDVHWDLFIKPTEKSCSQPQDLGSLHRKPHSLLPSHQGQPYSWSFTRLFSYLEGLRPLDHVGNFGFLFQKDMYMHIPYAHLQFDSLSHVLVWTLLLEAPSTLPGRNIWKLLGAFQPQHQTPHPYTTVTVGASF